MSTTFPELVDVFSIGKTYHGRDIWCVRLTNKTVTTAKSEFYIVGEHHAREMISVENCLYFIDYVVYYTSFGMFHDLLADTEIYVIPMLNPDGLSIMHFFPEQRKNLNPIDDDEDGLNDTNLDGFLDDELERIYFWNDLTNTSEIIESDLDGDLQTAEDLPGGVDLNRNYGAYWNGTGSSEIKIDPDYRGESPFSELETQILRNFMIEHSFNFAVSIHSGIKAIIPPWAHNGTLPYKDETEFNALLGELKTTLGYPLWNESGLYTANGAWEDYCYANHDIIGFTFEVYEAPWTGSYFDYYNPEGSYILTNCEQVFEGLIYMAYEPRLTYSNNLPSIEVSNPSTVNQVFDNFTIRWTMSDDDEDSLNCSVFVSTDNLHWDVLKTNIIDESSYFWDVRDVEAGSYYIKVAAYDGMDRITDTNEIKLNVNKEAEGSQFAFWLLAGIFGGLAAVYLFFYIRKSKGVSKIWGPDPYEEEPSQEENTEKV
ncbi:MAG: hypothetical protein GOP50_03870 [Candidatus Heimdallarchaeota archaeon]|nr:hypothetical protein [Candidatus Heimdallarchaeota archaeon]